MKIDYERLKKVKTSFHHKRGDGRTFATCHEALQMVEKAEPNTMLIWPIPKHNWVSHIAPMLTEMATHLQVQHKVNTRELIEFYNGIRLRLLVLSNEQQWQYFRGLKVKFVHTFGEFEQFATPRQSQAYLTMFDQLG